MATIPAALPVTTPVVFTVAIVVFSDSQGVVGLEVPDPASIAVLLTQTDNVPVIIGAAATVTVAVLLQPKVFL
jgi:hypothetical protein